MSTLRVSNIEAKADPSSSTVDEQVKITNSNGDVLLYVDGRTSGITTVGINTTAEVFKVDSYKNFEYSGIITAASFSGPIDASTGTFSGDVTISGNLGVAGTITYEDVARVDATGISTFREGFGVGPLAGIALTAYSDGSIRTSGIITASSFSGSLAASNLTGALPAISGASLTGINTAFGNSSVNTTGIITATAFIPSAGQLSHRNLIINGEMQVAQHGTAEITAPDDTSTYRADRYRFAENTSGSVGMSIQNGTGEFEKCLKVRVLSTDTSVGSNDRATIVYVIEDKDAKQLQWGTSNGKSVTLSFWVRSNVAGQTFCLNVYNSGTNNRTYIAEYTLPSGTANTWQKKTLTIPGDTTGTWGHIAVRWVLMGGSDKVGSAGWGAWSGSGGLEMQTSNQYNWMGDSNDFHLTGVQLEVGSVATPFEHRSYGDEFLRCCRYYYKLERRFTAAGRGAGSSAYLASVSTPVPLRAQPTIGTGTNSSSEGFSIRVYKYDGISDSSATPTVGTGGWAAGNNHITIYQGSHSVVDDRVLNIYMGGGYIDFNSEL